MRSKAKYLFYVLAAVLVWLFVSTLDAEALVEHYHKMGWHFYGVMAISLLAYTFATLGWLFCLDQLMRWSQFKPYFLARLVGEIFSTINPTGILAGDALKIHLLTHKGEARHKVVESVTVSRVLLWVSFVLVLIVTLVLFSSGKMASTVVFLLLSSALVAAAVLLLVILFHPKTYIYRAIQKLQAKGQWAWLEQRLPQLLAYNNNTVLIWQNHRQKLLIAIGLFGIHYLLGALEFQYILWSLSIDIEFSMAVYLEVATSFLRSVMAFIPGQVGVEEYGNKYFLSMLGITDDKIWMTVSIIRRLRQVLWLTVAIISYFWYFRASPSTSFHNAKNFTDGRLVH